MVVCLQQAATNAEGRNKLQPMCMEKNWRWWVGKRGRERKTELYSQNHVQPMCVTLKDMVQTFLKRIMLA